MQQYTLVSLSPSSAFISPISSFSSCRFSNASQLQLQQRASCPELRTSGNENVEHNHIFQFTASVRTNAFLAEGQSFRLGQFNISGTRKMFNSTEERGLWAEKRAWMEKNNLIHDILSKWDRGGSCRTSAERSSELSQQPNHWLWEIVEKCVRSGRLIFSFPWYVLALHLTNRILPPALSANHVAAVICHFSHLCLHPPLQSSSSSSSRGKVQLTRINSSSSSTTTSVSTPSGRVSYSSSPPQILLHHDGVRLPKTLSFSLCTWQ